MINIDVETKYIAEQSDPDSNRFVFAYTISIQNNSDDDVQLLNRYWLITDANSKKIEVQGPGVVGEQPVIAPEQKYSYTSGCILETELGTMEGHYEFKGQDEELFKQPIPVFRLSVPNIVH
jgi:ApaG protein|tara:strand:- start:67 stop:429 length:363 start_codon:yes stop_codon:yes gene_type:complete